MHNEAKLLSGGMAMLGIATGALVVIPYMTVRDVPPSPGLKPYTAAELRGRAQYVANGCVYCHSQQPRARSFAPDFQRGWGRASVAGDYAYDRPHLLGTMRTGPDLLNVGARQPSREWHLGHLYQPRAYVPASIMPSYPYLFEARDQVQAGEVAVGIPPGWGPPGKRYVVAKQEALDLVTYLLALDRTYPVIDAPAAPGERP